MKVSLVKEQTVRNYEKKHAGARASCVDFISRIKTADWEKPNDIKATFGSVDLLGKGTYRTVFDIGGNNHRFICKYRFGKRSVRLYVLWLGTHAEYTALCDKEQQYTADNHEKYI